MQTASDRVRLINQEVVWPCQKLVSLTSILSEIRNWCAYLYHQPKLTFAKFARAIDWKSLPSEISVQKVRSVLRQQTWGEASMAGRRTRTNWDSGWRRRRRWRRRRKRRDWEQGEWEKTSEGSLWERYVAIGEESQRYQLRVGTGTVKWLMNYAIFGFSLV